MNLRKDHYHTIQTLRPREPVAGAGSLNGPRFLAATLNINQNLGAAAGPYLIVGLASRGAAHY